MFLEGVLDEGKIDFGQYTPVPKPKEFPKAPKGTKFYSIPVCYIYSTRSTLMRSLGSLSKVPLEKLDELADLGIFDSRSDRDFNLTDSQKAALFDSGIFTVPENHERERELYMNLSAPTKSYNVNKPKEPYPKKWMDTSHDGTDVWCKIKHGGRVKIVRFWGD